MVTIKEKHKKMIRTVIKQLPQYIRQYSNVDQTILTNFLLLLENYEEAEKNREYLKHLFLEHNNKLLGTKEYLHTPFLWFSRTYFRKAHQILSLTDFHAHSFYEYLAKQLRSEKKQPGVFELIRKNIPLTNFEWEQLQYKCNRMLVPLSSLQYELIQKMFNFIINDGINALDPQLIKKQLLPLFSKGVITKNDLLRFFATLESSWVIRFHSQAFGLNRLFYHIQTKDTPFEKIIPYHNSENTVLNMSDIFVNRDTPMDYMGVFYIPKNDVTCLKEFLKDQVQEGSIKIKNLSTIVYSHRSISLDLYKVDEGWSTLKESDLNQLANEIRKYKVDVSRDNHYRNYLSPPFNKEWLFSQHQLPIEIIRIYCEVPSQYTFSDILSDSETMTKIH